VQVGDIRDVVTAQIATEAALTGQHALGSLQITTTRFKRLPGYLRLGVEAHLVAPTIVGILSQRLVRRVCSACKETSPASPNELEPFFKDPRATTVTLYRGRTCKK